MNARQYTTEVRVFGSLEAWRLGGLAAHVPSRGGGFDRKDARLRGRACGLRRSLCGLTPADRSLPPSPPLASRAAQRRWHGGGVSAKTRVRRDASALTPGTSVPSRAERPGFCGGIATPLAVRRRRAGGRNQGAGRPRRFRPALARRPSRTLASSRERSVSGHPSPARRLIHLASAADPPCVGGRSSPARRPSRREGAAGAPFSGALALGGGGCYTAFRVAQGVPPYRKEKRR